MIMVPVVEYLRYSSDNQREESIEAQHRAIKEFCDKNGYEIIHTYKDEALSATSDQRPEFMNMISDSKNGTFKAVICHKLDRFARNRYDSAIYKKTLKGNGVRLISVLENFDDSPESIILESVLEGMAEYYSANLSREVMKGLKENALQCKHTGGKPPFGYDVVNKEYVINDREATAVRQLISKTSAGQSYQNEVYFLNENLYKTKYGTSFTARGLNELLKNEKYTGVYTYNKNKRISINGKKQNIKHDEESIIRIEEGIPSIVEKEVFEKVQEILNSRKSRSFGASTAKEIYLLSGKLYCGNCGGSMNGARYTGGTNKHLYIVYECANRKRRICECKKKDVNRDRIESIVISVLEQEILSEESISMFIDRIYEYASSLKGDIPKDIKSYELELQGINRQIDNIVNAIASGMFHQSMRTKMDDLENSKEIITKRINEAQRQLNTISVPDKDIMYKYFSQYMNLTNKSLEQKRAAVETFVKKVIVYDDHTDIHIDYTIIHGAEGNRTPVRKPIHCSISHYSQSFMQVLPAVPSTKRRLTGS